MILAVTLSKPVKEIQSILGRPYIRAKIKLNPTSAGSQYSGEFFTETQAFHKNFSEKELESFLAEHAGKSFKNCVTRTESEEIMLMANKKGRVTELRRKLKAEGKSADSSSGFSSSSEKSGSPLNRMLHYSAHDSVNNFANRKKNYILEEGHAVPFLVALGVMTESGKVISTKYDKFRQINRFLEFINDVLPSVISLKQKNGEDEKLRIIDFGSGKSYLTFAVHYFLTEIKKLDCSITGLDLKKEVIENCGSLAKKLGLNGLEFKHGNISDYDESRAPDIVITLHACDVATDYALNFAVQKKAKAILSVPCCQHKINSVLKKVPDKNEAFAPLLKYGILKERLSAIVTDALRADILEQAGYSVNVMEFIDMEGTPKNLLIRAVLQEGMRGLSSPKNDFTGNVTNGASNDFIYGKNLSLSAKSLVKSLGLSDDIMAVEP